MGESVVFEVPGKPVAKGRPRFARRGNFVTAYTDAKTANYETLVRWFALQAMRGRAKLVGPLRAEINIFLPVPQSWPEKKKAAALSGALGHTSRPDLDNYLKAAIDGVNGVVFGDDAQVCEIVAQKRYGGAPCMRIEVTKLG